MVTAASYASFVATALGFPLAASDDVIAARPAVSGRRYASSLDAAPAIAALSRLGPRIVETIEDIAPFGDRIANPTGSDAGALAARILAAGRKRRGEHVVAEQERPKDESSRLAAQIIAAGRKRRGEIE